RFRTSGNTWLPGARLHPGGRNPSLYLVCRQVGGKKRGATGCASFQRMCGGYQAALTSRALASVTASLPRIKARRIGLITNRASSAAVALSATAITNTARPAQ